MFRPIRGTTARRRPGPRVSLSVAAALVMTAVATPAIAEGTPFPADEVSVVAAHALTDTGDHVLRVRVRNDATVPVAVESLTWAVGGDSGTESVGGDIPAGSVAVVDVPIDNPAGTVSYTVAVDVGAEDPVRAFGALRPVLEPVTSIARQTVVVDGMVDDDVRALPGIDLATEATPPTRDWAGPDDLSGTIWFTWDDDYVYLTAEIMDDVHRQTSSGDGIWGGDSIQVAFSSGAPGETLSRSEFGIALESTGGVTIWRWHTSEGEIGPVEGALGAVTRDDAENTTTYELALPWDRLAPMNRADRLLPVSLVLNEDDGSGRGNGHWFAWGDGIASSKDTALYHPGRLDLVHTPPPVDVVPPQVSASFDEMRRALTITATDDGWGVARIEYHLGDEVWITYSSPVAVGEEGATVRYRAADRAGNVSAIEEITVPAGAGSSPSGVVAIRPVRLVDDPAVPGDGAPVCVSVSEHSVPAWATGLLVNVTSVRPSSVGHAVVFPSGEGAPSGSTVNFEPGREVANAAVVKLGADQRICYATRHGLGEASRLIVDLMGYVEPDAGLVLVSPDRVADTRPGARHVGALEGPLTPREVHEIQVAGEGQVPADATAVLANVTVVGATGAGNLRVFPGGAEIPATSTVNYAPGQTKANVTFVQLGDGGTVSVYSDTPLSAERSPVQVVIDVLGYVRPGIATFTTIEQTRVVDTRAASQVGPLEGALVGPVGHRIDLSEILPAEATSAILSVVAVRPTTVGNLRVYPGAEEVADTSTVNFIPGRDIPNLVVAGLDEDGTVSLYADQPAHGRLDLVVDVVGYVAPPSQVELLLSARDLPDLALDSGDWPERREELVALLADEVYGHTPPAPEEVRATVAESAVGELTRLQTQLSFDTPSGEFSFPVDYLLPPGDGPFPLIVLVAFGSYPSMSGLSADLLVETGTAVAIVGYQTVTTDSTDFTNGLAGHYPRDQWDWGKIGMWAFAASRVVDHAVTLDKIDPDQLGVIGHSRLGKTALWAGAQDERFSLVVSNNSGAGGAALARGNQGERIADVVTTFPFWFSPRYVSWGHRENDAPFDQHFLLASIAPRALYVASASQDEWADPTGEFLGAVAASPAWTNLGLPGLVHGGLLPQPDDQFHDGMIGYHLRPGPHALRAYDWQRVLAFFGGLTP